MKTWKFKVKINGKEEKLSAVLKEDMTLSKAKSNQASDLIENFGDENRWSLVFDIDNQICVEVVMYRDNESGNKRPEPDYAIIWDKVNDCTIDEVDVKYTFKM